MALQCIPFCPLYEFLVLRKRSKRCFKWKLIEDDHELKKSNILPKICSRLVSYDDLTSKSQWNRTKYYLTTLDNCEKKNQKRNRSFTTQKGQRTLEKLATS